MTIFDLLVGGVVGLLIGWNFFPQPTWVRNLFGLN